MVFSYTLKKRLNAGNRTALIYTLTDVQDDSTSILRTPFKQIKGWIVENIGTATTTVRVVSTAERTAANNETTVTLDAGTDNDEANILVWGLL